MTFPMKNSVLDNFPPCPPAQAPPGSANFIFIVVSLSLIFARVALELEMTHFACNMCFFGQGFTRRLHFVPELSVCCVHDLSAPSHCIRNR